MDKVGWYTTWSVWGEKEGHCAWWGCRQPKHKGMFCKEHGKVKVTVGIVVPPKNR